MDLVRALDDIEGFAATRPMRGVRLLPLRVNSDQSGDLVAFEPFASVPFALRRVFVIKIDSPEVERGGHSNSCEELIVPVSGSVVVDCDNGEQRAAIRLTGHRQGLWVSAGIVIRLRAFDPDTVLLVCASALYGDTSHFPTPQPHLLKAN